MDPLLAEPDAVRAALLKKKKKIERETRGYGQRAREKRPWMPGTFTCDKIRTACIRNLHSSPLLYIYTFTLYNIFMFLETDSERGIIPCK